MDKKDIHSYVNEKEPNICQICIRKNGEELFSEEWNEYKKTDCTHIMSVTKSIVGLLTGIAIDKGMIRSVDEKVISYFSDYIVKRGEKTISDVTIRHLLTMRAPYKGVCVYCILTHSVKLGLTQLNDIRTISWMGYV